MLKACEKYTYNELFFGFFHLSKNYSINCLTTLQVSRLLDLYLHQKYNLISICVLILLNQICFYHSYNTIITNLEPIRIFH